MELVVEARLPSVVNCNCELELKRRVDPEIFEREAEVDVDSTAPEVSAGNAIGLESTAKELMEVRAEGMPELVRLG